MCGIVAGIAERDIVPVLMEGLRRLEYRGYDSAGIVALAGDGRLERRRAVGKVGRLDSELEEHEVGGRLGMAHTRWATHGEPSERNAHPHVSGDEVALVHNGIIENHEALREELHGDGYDFDSETDSEVVAHLVHRELRRGNALPAAVRNTVERLEGAYALVVIHRDQPDLLVAARMGCPVVIGRGIGETFVASDVTALLPVTNRFQFLEDGDIASLTRDNVVVRDRSGKPVERPIKESELSAEAVERGEFRHFMLKEIYEQPRALAETLEERIANGKVLEAAFGPQSGKLFEQVRAVHIVACGTSFHAGLVARHLVETLAGLPVAVEVASEYRYRQPAVPEGTLFVTISQSGETADTLAALRMARTLGYAGALTICNVPESSLVRESELVLMTRAGPEIGVASTKAFTTQLAALALLAVVLGRRNGLDAAKEKRLVGELQALPDMVARALKADTEISRIAELFADKEHALFLGRGASGAIALEGALKLKEISYIHAEAYPAGELKHGPLALVDENMPVVVVAPNDDTLEKLKSNLAEVRARGGELIVFTDVASHFKQDANTHVVELQIERGLLLDPVTYTVPLQLLAYHVAVLRGTDVDQPRNLAKSVTVE
ncbi:MAG: glutamine--fructose-6-phosphate transaminase (isomerizing) [Gammaproteobacteria bacterium]|nr:glutamine--fructose-6-phosphate transaminase (isomerizing) [Gammaproteobacteria bacterium]